MGVARILGFLIRASLALLPLAAAAVFVAFFARDAAETASAVLAIAAVLSLASLGQVALLIRDNRRTGEKQDDMRVQALALARCMKALNQRMAELEEAQARFFPTHPVSAPLTIPISTPLSPHAPANDPVAVSQAVAPALPAQEPVAIITLPQRRAWGVELLAGAEPRPMLFRGRARSHDEDMAARVEAAAGWIAREASGFVLAILPNGLAAAPRATELVGQLADHDMSFRIRFLLGVPQKIIRTGGAAEAQALAGLARKGVNFALVDVADFRIDPEALAACNITHVRIDAARLIAAAEDTLTGAATDAAHLAERLRAGGIMLMCSGVDEEAMTRDLNELGVALAQGAALTAPKAAAIVPIPWRAAPAPVSNATQRAAPPLYATR